MSSEVVDYKGQVEAVREAFEREFGRFARFRDDEESESLALGEAEGLLRELSDVRTRHTAKKSALSQLMKLIGRVPAAIESSHDCGGTVSGNRGRDTPSKSRAG